MISVAAIRSRMAPSNPVVDTQLQPIAPPVEEGDVALATVIAGCQFDDPAMQRQLYDLSHQQLFRLAVRMVGRQDAADVCQLVYLKVFDSIKQFAGRSSLMTWLYRIAVNECLQYRRKRGSRPTLQLADFEPA